MQALKQEHEVMREKSKATEDKVVQLMESYTASKTSWDKEVEGELYCEQAQYDGDIFEYKKALIRNI